MARINILRTGLDKNLQEIKIVEKWDSMGINQGFFYVDVNGELEVPFLSTANALYEKNAVIRS